MRVVENPGQSIEVETGARNTVGFERVSPFVVRLSVATRTAPRPAVAELDYAEGLALLHGLAALYDCHVVEN